MATPDADKIGNAVRPGNGEMVIVDACSQVTSVLIQLNRFLLPCYRSMPVRYFYYRFQHSWLKYTLCKLSNIWFFYLHELPWKLLNLYWACLHTQGWGILNASMISNTGGVAVQLPQGWFKLATWTVEPIRASQLTCKFPFLFSWLSLRGLLLPLFQWEQTVFSSLVFGVLLLWPFLTVS